NDDTLVVYLLSNEEDVKRYENDLIEQIAQHEYDLTTLAITEGKTEPSKADYTINFGRQGLDPKLWSILCTLPGQIIGFYKSLLLGYSPDNPSPDGTIARVVEGVTIYDDITSIRIVHILITVCANPSVVSFWKVGSLERGTTNRSEKESFFPGGKGIHTALALAELGQQVTTLGLWGGQTGRWLQHECNRRDI